MEKAMTIAHYFLRLATDDSGELLSNLKLQKLLYYAQGFYLALYNQPLFEEKLLAWTHGPVVAEVYHKYKEFGSTGIVISQNEDFGQLPPQVTELLNEVFMVYGQFSAWKLRDLTHEDPPWKETPLNEEISHDLLRSHFQTQLEYA